MSAAVSKNLDELFERVNYKIEKMFSNTGEIDLEDCLELLENYYGADWENLVEFKDGEFNKVPLDVGNKDAKFDAWLICWSTKANSGVHDHAEHGCIQKVLSGVLKESRYRKVGKGAKAKIELDEERKLRVGNVGFIDNCIGFHSIENRSSVNNAVTLHIYSPPNYVTKYYKKK